ncbi:MAG: M15 family metallopeptidase [Bacteroidales bacterium]|nr:M15 family metallopeptidase [Bacteroidales bacterium]
MWCARPLHVKPVRLICLLLGLSLACLCHPLSAATDFLTLGDGFTADTVSPQVRARMIGRSMPSELVAADSGRAVFASLRYLRVRHVDFGGQVQTGELVCHRDIAEDLLVIFKALYEARYPIASIRLIDDFEASDEASMTANNTSCFNYRPIAGRTALSRHALGMAVDINPLQNPYVRGEVIRPAAGRAYADRAQPFAHKIDRDDLCYKLFRSRGFSWGGAWRSAKDYQHFEK